MKRLPLYFSFILFIALCASLTYWVLQFSKSSSRPIAPMAPASAPPVNIEAAATLFGGKQQANTAVASNIELKGVIDAGRGRDSVAILSADGKPALALVVGTELLPGLNVKEIHAGYVLLSEGGAVKRVELPEKAKETVAPQNRGAAAPRPTAPPPPTPAVTPATAALPPAPPTPAASLASQPAATSATPALPPTPPGLYTRPGTPAQSGPPPSAPAATPGVPAAPAPGTAPAPAPSNRQAIVPAMR